MIYLDTNVFLRFLVAPVTAQDRLWHAQATELMEAVRSGSIHATCSEVVIHEVCHVLGSKRQYGMQPSDIIDLIRTVLSFAGMRFDGEQGVMVLRAFEIWSRHPCLEFSDSVIAARCERSGYQLATFDRHFRDLPFLQLWQPEAPAPDGP